jgi:hypothetical protein
MRDIDNLGKWALRMLQVAIACEVILVLHTAALIAFWQNVIPVEYAETIDSSGEFVSVTYLAVIVVCYVVCGRWIYRASFNAAIMNPHSERITPGWAVGWFAVPIFSLWKPYQAMRQTWNSTFHSSSDMDAPAPSMLGWWWAGWVIMTVMGQISLRMTMNGSEDSYATSLWVDLAGFPVAVAATLLFMQIVQRVTAAQTRDNVQDTFA